MGVRFAGGGSLDGDVREIPARARTVTTTDRGGRSWYVIDDNGAGHFSGLDDLGAEMTGIIRAFTDAVAGRKPEPVPAPDPKGCSECGLMFSSNSAWSVHLEPMPGGHARCMPASRLEGALLREVDGVWCLPGFER